MFDKYIHTSQEQVDEIHLENGVEKVHQVTNEEHSGVPVVFVKRLLHIFHQSFAGVFPVVNVESTTSEAVGNFLHSLVFVHFPEIMGQIKHDSLEE